MKKYINEDPILSALSESAKKLVLKHKKVRNFYRGEIIVQPDSKPDGVYFTFKGLTRVYHRNHDGRELCVKYLESPTTLCEMQVLANEIIVNGAMAMNEVQAFFVPAEIFNKALEDSPRATAILLKETCRKFCIAAKNEKNIFFKLDEKLAGLFYSLGENFGKDFQTGGSSFSKMQPMEESHQSFKEQLNPYKLNYPITQKFLADNLGVSDRAIRTHLQNWQSNGYLTLRKGFYILRDLELFKEISNGSYGNLNYRIR